MAWNGCAAARRFPTLCELGRETDEADAEINQAVVEPTALATLELRSLFTGEHDERDAVCEIHSGEGGTDAQDWAEMMLRMYLRWAERRGFEVELDEVSAGQEAGILSATFIVKGRHAYGMLCSERGVHRLYRISPFDSQARRQTSYAALDVVPFIEDVSDEVEIDDKELRVDTYRSSGAGGQHVNVTDSAVRITHLPTSIVVSCSRTSAASSRTRQGHADPGSQAGRAGPAGAPGRTGKDLRPPGSGVPGGSFIRGYVMAPYQTVKDERTGHETGNVQAMLDGDLDEFIESWLRWRRSDGGSA